jgi:hypothetical protein
MPEPADVSHPPLTRGLSADEDAELRRLHALIPFSHPDSPLVVRYEELRARDRRGTVRELEEEQVAHVLPPRQRTAPMPYPDDRDPPDCCDPLDG